MRWSDLQTGGMRHGLAAVVLLLGLGRLAEAGTFVVTNVNDDGAGSLRQAILAANASAGADTIAFAIPGAGLHTIQITSAVLPNITGPLTIDGYTQPGSSGNTLAVGDNAVILVEIDFNNFAGSGLTIASTAPNTLVKGLAMRRAGGGALLSIFGDGAVVQGNFLGTNAAGTASGPGSIHGVFVGAANVLVGGTAPAQRNVIAGNSANINVQSLPPYSISPASAVIQGNYLGTNASGTAAITSNYGVVAVAGTADVLGTVLIGGTAAGSGNLISGNALNGIRIELGGGSGTAGAVTIQGNTIGLDVTGTNAIPNKGDAIYVARNTSATMGPVLIGGPTAAARNVVSSTGSSGRGIVLNGVTAAVVQGNFIGTDATGMLARPNQGYGLQLANGAAATIGGAAAGEGNLISANLDFGLVIGDSTATVLGNRIGTMADGVTPLPNGSGQIFVSASIGSAAVTVGGTAPGAGNRIVMGSSGTGVAVRGSPNRTTIRGNSIALSAPSGYSISLSSTTEPVFNDACDADAGPNGLQNFPVVTVASIASGTATIAGTLNSTASTSFLVDFYSSPACTFGSYNYGPGRTYLGSTTVTTNPSCSGSFNLTLPVPPGESIITATATDPAGNTSEFSQCVAAGSAPAGSKFYTLPPCRILDTRDPAGAFGGPALQPGATRTYAIPAAPCGVPTAARSVSSNVTVTGATQAGYLTLYPADGTQPLASSLNFSAGLTRANNVVLPLSTDGTGSIKVFTGSVGSVEFILDVNGYFK